NAVPDTGRRENVTTPPAGPNGPGRQLTHRNERIRRTSRRRCQYVNTSWTQTTSASAASNPAPIAAYRSASCDPVSGMPRVLSDAMVTNSPDTHLTLATTPVQAAGRRPPGLRYAP